MVDGFVDALLAAPLGAALLALVEGASRPDVHEWELPSDSDGDAVLEAAEAVRTWSFGSLVARAVYASYMQVGPWSATAVTATAAACRHAERRLPIAEAIDVEFGEALHQPLDADAQQWWHSAAEGFMTRPRFRSFDSVYGAGQFTWDGLWTVTAPPTEAHGELVAAWELDPHPVSRWSLPVRAHARVVEIHRPEDWMALVAEHPAVARAGDDSWELPGPNQHVGELTALLALPDQRAARPAIRRHLEPDWKLVAADVDGVHLSWAGFLTTEGFISDLGDGDVTMLRYWFSERTHWLADVFGEPEPLAAPDVDTDGSGLDAVDARTDLHRRGRDHRILMAQLGR